jgi:hypothetical protein
MSRGRPPVQASGLREDAMILRVLSMLCFAAVILIGVQSMLNSNRQEFLTGSVGAIAAVTALYLFRRHKRAKAARETIRH